jgi:hypothetical protein
VPAVRAEFGPTLPELLAPRWRAIGPAGRVAAVALVAAAAAAVLLVRLGEGDPRIAVRHPVAYTLRYGHAVRSVAPGEGVQVALRTVPGRPRETFVVRPLRLAPYAGDATAALMARSAGVIERLRAGVPSFVLRGEGRVRVSDAQGYQVQYSAREDGRTLYGRYVMLLPAPSRGEPRPRDGVVLDLRSVRSPAVPYVGAVGGDGALKLPYTSFHFSAGG